jgi:hypothetical protein
MPTPEHQRREHPRVKVGVPVAIPNSEALDRLLRYETTIERSLTRSLDRLERLQRRRSEERTPQELNRSR